MAAQKNPRLHWHVEQFTLALTDGGLPDITVLAWSKPYDTFEALRTRVVQIALDDLTPEYTPSLHVYRCERPDCLEDDGEES